jgi:ATP-dependent DNA ligase
MSYYLHGAALCRVAALSSGLCVNYGRIVIADHTGAADFGAMQTKAGRRGAQTAAAGNPAVLLAFDRLRHAGTNLIDMPLHTRR